MRKIFSVREPHGIKRENAYLRLGFPLPKGEFFRKEDVNISTNSTSNTFIFDLTPILYWPDGSMKWVHGDFCFDISKGSTLDFFLENVSEGAPPGSQEGVGCEVKIQKDALRVENGIVEFTFKKGSNRLIEELGIFACLTSRKGIAQQIKWDEVSPIFRGRLRVDIESKGTAFIDKKRLLVRMVTTILYNSPQIHLMAEVHNPHAALHPGGMWDLGDPGSIFFEDFSIHIEKGVAKEALWMDSPERTPVPHDPSSSTLVIYQDSSGGKNWDSPNHVDKDGALTVSFKGYRVLSLKESGQIETLEEGLRASPAVALRLENGPFIEVAIQDFWENFPKAISIQKSGIRMGLFPGEAKGPSELQGGEKKRHFFMLAIPTEEPFTHTRDYLLPLEWALDPEWVRLTGAISYFLPESEDKNDTYLNYVKNVIQGQDSFFKKREIIDEFGWRNFGDIYGDHEAVNHKGDYPFVSHYNNQYDFIYGAIVHFLRSSDWRWWRLAQDLAHHVADIDIYHTKEDKAAYNHGLFWHTDHYKEAKTATHRCYSRKNETTGGGPSNEHNYTTGLLYHYLLTGDGASRDAVLELAQWVLDMDNGERTLFAPIESGPTGLASQTVEVTYHGPGRGAGNSINALMDAYILTRNRDYLFKAEDLIRRTIHPRDKIEKRRLDDPEYRWSYLVYLQVLSKYLDLKEEWGERDWMYFYARESLLHYAQWMLEHEVPYKEVLHKVDIPTETWPAQDIRKACVLNFASKHAPASKKKAFLEKARYFFDRCILDLLSFDTAYLARPMVLLMVYGHIQSYFDSLTVSDLPEYERHFFDFGAPMDFVPQRQRLKHTLGRRIKASAHELKRLIKEKAYRVLKR